MFFCLNFCPQFLFEFLSGSSFSINIFIKTIFTHTHFYYIHTLFYLISYIYTHPTQKKKKKTLYFQSKLCLIAIFHKIKFIFTIFIVKFLKSFIFITNYQIKFYSKVTKKIFQSN